MKSIIISTGGTGGHIFPALALSDFAKKKGYKVNLLVGKSKVSFETKEKRAFFIKTGEILGSGMRLPLNLLKILVGTFQTLYYFLGQTCKETRVVASGSFASLPVLLVSRFLSVPYYLLEQNVMPGETVRRFAKGAKGIFVSFERTRYFLSSPRLYVTGNPLREKARELIEKEKAKRELGLEAHARVILILGGSQGSRKLIETSIEAAKILKGFIFLIQTGRFYKEVDPDDLPSNAIIFDFRERIGLYYSASDLVVSRAGGGTIAEIAYFRIPCIVIPFPHAAGGHQKQNAETVTECGGGIVIEEEKLTPERLANHIREIFGKEETYETMKERISTLRKKNSEEAILRIIEGGD